MIVARDDAVAGELAGGLDRLGWRTITARGPYAAAAALADLQIEAAVVDLSQGLDAFGLGRKLKAACSPRRIPIVAIGKRAEDLSSLDYDLVLPTTLHPAQVGLRLEQLIRAAVAEEEFELRRETFRERGSPLLAPQEPDRPPRVLTVGEPAPRFLALSNALREAGADAVGAFTPYTAFDYLHDQPFDAVVLWAGDETAEALSIAAGMRRNTRLFHVPAMLYADTLDRLNLSEVFHRGVSDVAGPEISEVEAAERVLELAQAYRRQSAIRQALERARGSGLMDAATGLFTRDLFATHLGRISAAARARNRPLSVAVLRISDRPEMARARTGGWLDRAVPQIGSMISRLVRAEDVAARLAPEIFALALPATPLHAARAVGERIAAVIGCTAFEAGRDRPPFVVEFDVGAAELEAGEHPVAALERAATDGDERRAAG